MRRIIKQQAEEHNFWMSYTDLMSGFLIIFIILSLSLIHRYRSQANDLQTIFDSCNISDPALLANYLKDLEKDAHQLKGLRSEVEELKQSNARLTQMYDSVTNANLRNEILRYQDLFNSASNTDVKVEFNTTRGSIILTHKTPGKALFETGKHDLITPLRPFLDTIAVGLVQKTMEIAAENENRNIELRIEGHTDPTWVKVKRGSQESFVKNLSLSSQRANEVLQYVLEHKRLQENERVFAMEHMISVGYSFSERLELDKDNPGSINDVGLDDASRRIEIRILSKQ